MTVSIIAARSRNNVIGNGSDIPWKVKGEQKLFKDITAGGVLIMGRKTFESIGRPLPGRVTLIITRQQGYAHDGCEIVHSLEEALDVASTMDKPIFVAGGGEIYAQALPRADAVHLSTIEADVEGDVFFPDFPGDEFHLVSEERFESNIDYIYQYFERKALKEKL
jgi:dihydrofolate reductase (trimethoprim resistance protein)